MMEEAGKELLSTVAVNQTGIRTAQTFLQSLITPCNILCLLSGFSLGVTGLDRDTLI